MVNLYPDMVEFREQVVLNPNPRPHGVGNPRWYALTMEGSYACFYVDVDANPLKDGVPNDAEAILHACIIAVSVAAEAIVRLVPGTPRVRLAAVSESNRADKISYHLYFEFVGSCTRTLGDMIRYVYMVAYMICVASAADASGAEDGFAGEAFSTFEERGLNPTMARLVLRIFDLVPYKYKANIRGLLDAKASNGFVARIVDATHPLLLRLRGNKAVDIDHLLKNADPLDKPTVRRAFEISTLMANPDECRKTFEFTIVSNPMAACGHNCLTSVFTLSEHYKQPTCPLTYCGFTTQPNLWRKKIVAAREDGESWATNLTHDAHHPTFVDSYKPGIVSTPPRCATVIIQTVAGGGGGGGGGGGSNNPPLAVQKEVLSALKKLVDDTLGKGVLPIDATAWKRYPGKNGEPSASIDLKTHLCPVRLLAKREDAVHKSRTARVHLFVQQGVVMAVVNCGSQSEHFDKDKNRLPSLRYPLIDAPATLAWLRPPPPPEPMEVEVDVDNVPMEEVEEEDADDDIALPAGLNVSSDEEEEEEEEEAPKKRRRRHHRRVITSDSEGEEEEEEESSPSPSPSPKKSVRRSRQPVKEEVIVEEVPSDAEGTTPSPTGKKRKKSIDRKRAVNNRHAKYADGIDVVYESGEEASGDEVLSQHGSDSDDSCIASDDDDDDFPATEFQPDSMGDCLAFDVRDDSTGHHLGTQVTPYVWFVLVGEALLRARGDDDGLALLQEEAKQALFFLASTLVITDTFTTTHPTTGCRSIEDVVDNLNGACERAAEKLRKATVYIRTDDDEIRCVAQPEWLHRDTQHFIAAAAQPFVGLAFVDWEDPEEEEEKPSCGTIDGLRALLDEIKAKDEEIPLTALCTSIMKLIPPPESYVGPDVACATRKEFLEFRTRQREERRADAERMALRATGQMSLSEAFFTNGKSAPCAVVKKLASAASAWDEAVAVAKTHAPHVEVEHVGEPQAKRKKKKEFDPEDERKKKGLQSIAGFFTSFGAKK